jgi:hypothetical protein
MGRILAASAVCAIFLSAWAYAVVETSAVPQKWEFRDGRWQLVAAEAPTTQQQPAAPAPPVMNGASAPVPTSSFDSRFGAAR